VEAAFNNSKAIKLKRIERAELGLPDEISLPAYSANPIP
jgi:hypothetical protein